MTLHRYPRHAAGRACSARPTAASACIRLDARLRYRFDRRWSAAVGIDNLDNATYWAFQPDPQRTFSAELRADL